VIRGAFKKGRGGGLIFQASGGGQLFSLLPMVVNVTGGPASSAVRRARGGETGKGDSAVLHFDE